MSGRLPVASRASCLAATTALSAAWRRRAPPRRRRRTPGSASVRPRCSPPTAHRCGAESTGTSRRASSSTDESNSPRTASSYPMPRIHPRRGVAARSAVARLDRSRTCGTPQNTDSSATAAASTWMWWSCRPGSRALRPQSTTCSPAGSSATPTSAMTSPPTRTSTGSGRPTSASRRSRPARASRTV